MPRYTISFIYDVSAVKVKGVTTPFVCPLPVAYYIPVKPSKKGAAYLVVFPLTATAIAEETNIQKRGPFE